MHPIFIAGAAVVGLPILLHLLLRQQPKKLVFPALRFLKQRQKTNQRRVQLKHILLLALRCLLLLLFALALYQPTLSSAGGLMLSGTEPVAAVIVIDTSPSMGYRTGTTTRLDEARGKAKELLDQLPPNSKVAVLPSHDPSGTWQPTVLEAGQRLDALKEPSGSAESLAPALRAAYDLLATADEGNPDGADPRPRMIAVFGDRTSGSWVDRELTSLQAKRDAVPAPPPVQVFFDVGVREPQNLAIVELKMDTDRLGGAADAVVTAVVRADGLDVNGLRIVARLDDGTPEEAVRDIARGTTVPVVFTFRKPPPGFHTVTVKLDREDGLPFDNERSFTFEVLAKRRILAVADHAEDVTFWKLAHNEGPQEFECTVVTSNEVPELRPFEMVALIAVADPRRLKDTLEAYVKGGGKLLVAPDGPGSDTDDNRSTAYAGLGTLMPAALGKVETFPKAADDLFGRPWKLSDEADLRHRLFAPIREWQKGNIDIFRKPRQTKRYRTLPGVEPGRVIARYDAPEAMNPPAVVGQAFEQGYVLLLTTRIDDDADNDRDYWNDFWKRDHSWPVVFPWLVARYLCDYGTDGAGVDSGGKRRYNFPTGAEVPVSVRGFTPTGERRIRLEGPGVTAAKSKFTLPADTTMLTVRNKPPTDAPRTARADVWDLDGEPLFTQGTFALNPDLVESPWRYRFSIAVPPAESDLQQVPEQSVAELFGPDRVIALDAKTNLDELLTLKLNRTAELFPALMIGVLIFFAFEGLMANRFYRLK